MTAYRYHATDYTGRKLCPTDDIAYAIKVARAHLGWVIDHANGDRKIEVGS